VKQYLKEAVLPMLAPSAVTLALVWKFWTLLPEGAWWNFVAVAAAGVLSMAGCTWVYGLTEGEKAYVASKFKRA
jgi:hypothetical protein